MIDYLFSSQAPVKGEAADDTGLSSLFANVALAALVIILRPAVEKYFSSTINKHTPISPANRQSLKAIFVAGRDFISPALPALDSGFNIPHLQVTSHSATIATTVIKGVPTPVQLVQEQSTMGAIIGISVCLMFALVGTALVFQHSRQGSVLTGSSSTASFNNTGSSPPPSPPPSDFDSTLPSDDSSDDSSGPGGRPPPVPIFDVFYDAPILRADKAVSTNDKEVGDMDGAPPPPPPSFPTPVEDGNPFKSEAILKWSSLTLVLSILSLVINRLFKRFFKGYGKSQKVPTPTDCEWITVDEISGNVMSPIPSGTAKPVIKPTCPNMLPLVETESLGTSTSTLITSTVYQRSKRFANAAIICILFLTCLILLPYFLQDYIDNHLSRTINFICPATTRRQFSKASDAVEIVGSVDGAASVEDDNAAAELDDDDDVATSIGGEDVVGVDEEDIAASIGGELEDNDVATSIGREDVVGVDEEDIAALEDDDVATSIDGGDVAAGIDEEDIAASIDEEVVSPGVAAATDDLMKKSVEQSISFNHVVGAGDTTLIVYEKSSPLAVGLQDILDASEDDIPFLEVFSALSISSSSDEIPVFKQRSCSFTNPMFKLPTTSEINSSQDIRVLSEHVPKTNIPVVVEQVHTVSKLVLGKAASIVDKASNTAKVGTASKENAPIVNINKASAPARAETLPVLMKSSTTNMKTSSTEPLNPRAASFVPPASQIPVRQQPRYSSDSLSLHYRYSPPSPPSPPRPGLSASMHAPSPVRRSLSASMHAPSPPPRQGLSASIHAPSPPPMRGTSASIHAPSSPPMGGTSANMHAPPSTPPRRTTNSSTSAPIEHDPKLPLEPVPIPVVELSPNRTIRRLVDPRRECNVVVLVGGNSASAA